MGKEIRDHLGVEENKKSVTVDNEWSIRTIGTTNNE